MEKGWIVCIAEKPSVAKDIARIIGAKETRNGYMEGNGYQVTWTFGHLCELKMPEDYSSAWKAWRLEHLPMLPARFGIRLKDDKGIKKQFEVIERLMSKAERIVNCGDAGQEGELIQRWVMQKAGVKCPVSRLWISSMTDEAIREGFEQLKNQSDYDRLYMAGLSRAIGDWILGINATRLYSIKYGQPGNPLSIGRVQTPTLAMIVKRQQEIDAFKPETYWVLSTVYRGTVFTATKGRLTDKAEGEKALEQIKEKPFEIKKVEKKSGKEAPPHLYDLTSLQVDCNRKFGLSAEVTLNTIQSLYERKLTTYPRVDTQYLSEDVYGKCPATLNGLYQVKFSGEAPYAALIKPLGAKKLPKSKRVFDNSKVTDHHAIIPTGVLPTALTDLERKVYDLVARRFISVFYPDCKFSTTTVLGCVDKLDFKATGKEILDWGWKMVERVERKEESGDKKEESEEKTLPSFEKGESGAHEPTLTEKQTTPPKPYTEATLLRAMETAGKLVEDEELRAAMKENGIGRPSTRAAIIETLFRRRYIRKERKNIFATPTGIELIEIIQEDLLKSPELTGIWEKKLRDIEHNKYDAGQFINELKQQIGEIVGRVVSDRSGRRVTIIAEESGKRKVESGKRKKESVDELPVEGKVCPLCQQGTIIKGKTAYGCSRWKEGCTYRVPFKS